MYIVKVKINIILYLIVLAITIQVEISLHTFWYATADENSRKHMFWFKNSSFHH